MDPYSDVQITDTSGNVSELVREYSLYVNETYRITDMVEVVDEWNFKQDVTFQEGSTTVYLNIQMYYDG